MPGPHPGPLVRPVRAVRLATTCGSSVERVWTASIQVSKRSLPSWKKGRRSGKKRAKVVSASIRPGSDSTWLESGLKVASAVTPPAKA